MKERDLRFDFIRSISMFYIVAVLHLSQYLTLSPAVTKVYNSYTSDLLTNLALSCFSMISGYLIGSKYVFDGKTDKVWAFYKKRILRFYPMFLIASALLWLIGFNNLKATLFGLAGLAPFVAERPHTLWYISMLMLFYLITPLISRSKVLWKAIASGVVVAISCLSFKLLSHMDFRFVYNIAFYCLGVTLANQKVPILNQKVFIGNKKLTDGLSLLSILLFLVLVPISYKYVHKLFWPCILLGVIATFSLSGFVASSRSVWIRKCIMFVSYASMACYMFHRFFYWLGNLFYKTDNQWFVYGGGYLLLIVFPICLVCSFYVQKGYDRMINSMNKKP